MLEITALTGTRSPEAVTIALTLPLLLAICDIGVSVRISTPSDSATRTSAFGTAPCRPSGTRHRHSSACARCSTAPPATRTDWSRRTGRSDRPSAPPGDRARDGAPRGRRSGPCAAPSGRTACPRSCCCADRTYRARLRRSSRRRSARRCHAGAPKCRCSRDSRRRLRCRGPDASMRAAIASTSATRSSLELSSKKQRHCGSSGSSSSSSCMARPASANTRSSTRGRVRMVGPMSKRQPSCSSTAALPPSHALASNSTTR